MNEVKDMVNAIYDNIGQIEILYRQALIKLPEDKKHCWLPVLSALNHLKQQVSGAEKRIK